MILLAVVPASGQNLVLTLDDPNPQANAAFGFSLAGLGDVDGDRVPDLAVGAPAQQVGPGLFQGRVYLFSGGNGDLLFTLDDPDPQPAANFGFSLDGIGDVDGDGVEDLAVGPTVSWISA